MSSVRVEICSSSEATRCHDACVHALLGVLKLADLGVTTEPPGLAETTSRMADLFTTFAVPGRGGNLDVRAASSSAAAARGDAAQAACDWKTSHYRGETQTCESADAFQAECRKPVTNARLPIGFSTSAYLECGRC